MPFTRKTLKPNRIQVFIAAIGAVALLALVLFPPWQQTGIDRDYVKDIGRSYLLRPPQSVPVDCYFEGCVTAPASHFRVSLKPDLWFWQIGSVLAIAAAMIWLFRAPANGVGVSFEARKVRLLFSVLLALLVPLDGAYPLLAPLVDVPHQLIRRDELWLIPVLLVLVSFVVCSSVFYMLTSLGIKVSHRVRFSKAG